MVEFTMAQLIRGNESPKIKNVNAKMMKIKSKMIRWCNLAKVKQVPVLLTMTQLLTQE